MCSSLVATSQKTEHRSTLHDLNSDYLVGTRPPFSYGIMSSDPMRRYEEVARAIFTFQQHQEKQEHHNSLYDLNSNYLVGPRPPLPNGIMALDPMRRYEEVALANFPFQ